MSLTHYKTPAQTAFIKVHIMELILNMISMVNVGKTMNSKQIEFAAKMIVEDSEFRQLKPCEIETMFQNGIAGKYGKLYDRIDVSVFFEWKDKFMDQRFDEIMRYRQHEQTEYMKLTSGFIDADAPISEEGKKVISTLLEKFKPAYAPEAVDMELVDTTPRERTEYEQKSDEFFREFEAKILKGECEIDNDIPYVKINGKMLDKQQYHNKRWEEVFGNKAA